MVSGRHSEYMKAEAEAEANGKDETDEGSPSASASASAFIYTLPGLGRTATLWNSTYRPEITKTFVHVSILGNFGNPD